MAISDTDHRASRSGGANLRATGRFLGSALQWTAYRVLKAAQPLVLVFLWLMVIAGGLVCLAHYVLVRNPHFPTGGFLVCTIVCAVCIVLYHAVVDLLRPRT